jgi:guanylate kinase
MKRKATRLANRHGIIFILSAPSGAGKTTLVNGLKSVFPEIRVSVSCTTRARRSGEVNGRDYRFVTWGQFAAMKARGEFAEWAKVHDFYYGTPRKPLDQAIESGHDILLDIDVQGAGKLKNAYPQSVSVFLLPPSLHELRRRLALRGTDNKDIIRRRLANARGEIGQIIQYDYYVVNRDVTEAVALLKSIVEAERAKTCRVSQWRIESMCSDRALRSHE